MTEILWICLACDLELPQTFDRCLRCGCSQEADQAEVDQRRAAYEETRFANIQARFTCVKCGANGNESGQLRASGGDLSALLNLETMHFNFINCSTCGYTEFYRADTGLIR